MSKKEEIKYDTPVTCAVCVKCWKNKYGVCLYGGPFSGYYEMPDYKKENK